MNGKENAIKKIRLMRKEAEKTHETKIEELRKNSSFDELYRKINSLKWDFIRERNAETAGSGNILHVCNAALNEQMLDRGKLERILREWLKIRGALC